MPRAKDREASPHSEEARRLMDLLQTLARTMRLSNAELARRANVSLASLMRYFKGDAEPRLVFVLAVVGAIGLDVKEFFELAYPELKAPTGARQKIEKILGSIRSGKALESPRAPEPKTEVVPLRRKDVEKLFEDFRNDLLKTLTGESKRVSRKPAP